MPGEPVCFIIMPISTPPEFIRVYRGDVDHFKHVLECLIIPAVQKAGYKPITPIATGSDLIHAEIIKNLENSDLVLCDMSCLNPNVFFEFGIRTSLNKPICVIKDDQTEKIPFDIAMLNHFIYRSSLDTWGIEEEIKNLSEHIMTSAEKCNGENQLWKYFGFKNIAQPALGGNNSSEIQFNFITNQLDAIMQRFDRRNEIPDIIMSEERRKIYSGNRITRLQRLEGEIKHSKWPSETIVDEQHMAIVARIPGIKADDIDFSKWAGKIEHFAAEMGISIEFVLDIDDPQ
jgi:hypothetical protein